MQKNKLIASLKTRVKDAISKAQRGLTRKEIAKVVNVPAGSRDLASALDLLISESIVVRAGAQGAGYRYWLGNA